MAGLLTNPAAIDNPSRADYAGYDGGERAA
jgi:hypothetical protein